MKVIAFNGSPHSAGGTAAGISVMKGELEKEGIEVEVVQVGDKPIRGCMACGSCATSGANSGASTGKCAIGDDIVNECLRKLASADGIILGCPVYFGSIAGTFKSFLDRLFFTKPDLRYKVGASVVSVRRAGGPSTFHQLNNYFNLAQMIITPGVYWEVIHGTTREELAKDEEGVQIMEAQGRNMAWLIKALAVGKKEIAPPPHQQKIRTNFIR